jgi:cytochrome c biogenesis protein CcdA
VDLSLALAFAAGVVSFLTPCVLALVPVYLAILAEAAVGGPPSGSRAVSSAPPCSASHSSASWPASWSSCLGC